MRINVVSVEDGIDNLGFRKMSAFVRHINPDTGVYYVPTGNLRSLYRTLVMQGAGQQDEIDVCRIAEAVADADLVGFSSMTPYSDVTKAIIAKLRAINPKAFILWGGIHPIIHPDDAIAHADGICTGEGEFAFQRFFAAFEAGRDYTKSAGMWFNREGSIFRNANLPLQTPEEMSALPHLTYDDGEHIYKNGKGFVPIRFTDFVDYAGLAYNTVWSIGCPLKCTYCGNTKFIEYDKAYRRIRHPSVDYLIEEVQRATRKHPHLSTIVFHDDSFMALPRTVLTEFAAKFKKEIGLPCAVFGVIPNYVDADKLELLLDAGLNRVRMGIQSGSERILKFYKRPTPVARIRQSAEILNRYAKYMIPPAYDIILDNPIETREDTLATLDLVYEMPRPFTINFYSLRVIPNTELAKDIQALGIDIKGITSTYVANRPSLGNLVIYLLVLWRIPASWYRFIRRHVRPAHEPQREYLFLLYALRFAYLVKRAAQHLRFLDFTTITGRVSLLLWRTGLVTFWQRRMVRHYRADKARHSDLQVAAE